MHADQGPTASGAFEWRHSRALQLTGIGALAAAVIVRVGLMTYWSFSDASHEFLDRRLLLAWGLGLLVLAMLSRFAWQIHTGRHRTK